MSSDETFRILSLDGGGIRGVFGAAFLASLEEGTGKRVVDHFDLVTGTSTGGLLALGLALGHTPKSLLDFYLDRGAQIFPPTRWGSLKHLFRDKYSAEPLKNALIEFFGEDTKLGEARCRVVVPSFDANTGKPVCFKTRHHREFDRDHKQAVWEIGMATAAAPTYFPPYEASWGATYVDGGIWANRPTVVGMTEAVRFLGRTPQSIQMMSIGTAGPGFRLGPSNPAGALRWAWKGRIVSMLMSASECSAEFHSQLLIPRGQMLTIDDSPAVPIALDNIASMSELRGLGEQKAKERCREVAEQFLFASAAPFEPIPSERSLATAES